MTQDDKANSAARLCSAYPARPEKVLFVELSQEATEEFKREWYKLNDGPRAAEIVALHRRPRWKILLMLPWLWLKHYWISRSYTGIWGSAVIASRFVRVMWGVRAKRANGVCSP